MTPEVRAQLEALAADWANRVQVGQFVDDEATIQSNTYDNCSDELLELLSTLHTN